MVQDSNFTSKREIHIWHIYKVPLSIDLEPKWPSKIIIISLFLKSLPKDSKSL